VAPSLFHFLMEINSIMYFVDDYIKMSWVYLLKYKSQYFKTFKNFHVLIQNEGQSHIFPRHTNNWGEYTSNEFENYVLQHGIQNQTIIPYNSQHSGVAKIMNKTILNIVFAMMFLKNVKFMFLDDVVLCKIFMKKCFRSQALRNNIP